MAVQEDSGDRERIEALAVGADELTTALDELVSSVQSLEAKSETTRRVLWIISALVAAKIVTLVVLVIALVSLSDTNHRLKESLQENYVTAQQQAETRVKVLCPLYEVLLASAAVPSNPPLSAAAQKNRDAAVRIIRDGYTTLGCQPALP